MGYAVIGQVAKSCTATTARQAVKNCSVAKQVAKIQIQQVFKGSTAIK